MKSRPIRAHFHPQALRHNYAVARARAGASRLWAVVKANGYGHGLLPVAHALAGVADGFALLELAEAEALRGAGLGQPILMLEGFFAPAELARIVELDITPVVHSPRQLRWLEEARLARPVPVYLKVNTGMNRLGFPAREAASIAARLSALPQVATVTLMTHFAEADAERGIAWQRERFAAVEGALPRFARSQANSAALLRYPDTVGSPGDWARPGIMLYGSSPFSGRMSAVELGLRPAMTLESELIGVQELAPGERVGYGGLFQAERAMRVGIVACGYADGYPRHAPTGTPVAVSGRRTRTLGRISMDMLAVDLSGLPEAGPGAPVVLWGGQGPAHVPVDEVAACAGTVAYELLCALAPRVAVLP